jgi:hypothetical protein
MMQHGQTTSALPQLWYSKYGNATTIYLRQSTFWSAESHAGLCFWSLFRCCDDHLSRGCIIERLPQPFLNSDIPKVKPQPPLLTGKHLFGVHVIMQVFTFDYHERVARTAFCAAAISKWSPLTLISEMQHGDHNFFFFRKKPDFVLKGRVSCRNQF